MTAPGDRQSQAFREAGPADRWDGDVLALGARVHMPQRHAVNLVLPEHYEQGRGWDQMREPPKTLEQARALLAERIADPGAPDSEADAGAYDGLES
jgi:hypothetical protein